MAKGRPSKFNQALADKICEELADARSLRSICLDDGMPSQTTIFRWLADDRYSSFREQYTRAREAQADAIFDEILDIADDASNDWMERRSSEDEPLGWQLNGEHVQRSKLRIEARKWMAGKLAPKKYSDKLEIEHSGPDGGPLEVRYSRRAADVG